MRRGGPFAGGPFMLAGCAFFHPASRDGGGLSWPRAPAACAGRSANTAPRDATGPPGCLAPPASEDGSLAAARVANANLCWPMSHSGPRGIGRPLC
ncbi:unnamed protein product [Amoebophrya sp. A120]|nr:unnamed protein product [Amoebophrya sp. A120]|eukprot:GSA120T00007326001.1